MNRTQIEWTQHGYTWNPTTGCTHVSEGCRFCYAEALSLRFGHSAHPWTKPFEQENVKLHPDRLSSPFKIKPTADGSPIYCFVDSMSDLFHPLIPDDFIVKVWAVMAATPHITYQILTKRPMRMDSFAEAVAAERAAQDRHWPDAVQAGHTWPEWMLILGREYGEAQEAAGILTWDVCDRTMIIELRHELIQVSAVAAKIVDVIDHEVAQR